MNAQEALEVVLSACVSDSKESADKRKKEKGMASVTIVVFAFLHACLVLEQKEERSQILAKSVKAYNKEHPHLTVQKCLSCILNPSPLQILYDNHEYAKCKKALIVIKG
jgi:hypothetical protein